MQTRAQFRQARSSSSSCISWSRCSWDAPRRKLQPANMRSQLVTRETSQEETSAADSNRQYPPCRSRLRYPTARAFDRSERRAASKVAKENVSNYAWQSAILLVRAASFSACADCHALLLSLGELASELSHLFQLGRRCHAVALGHTADGDNALVLPLAVRAG